MDNPEKHVYLNSDLPIMWKFTVLVLLVSLASCSNENLLIKQHSLPDYPPVSF